MEAVTDTRSSFRRLLTTRGFIALVASNALGYGGEQMRIAAQSWWILDEGGSNTAVGLAAGLRVVPVVLISLYAGVMIDRFGGKRVLLVERWLLVALALATALVLLSDGAKVWHIVMLSTIAGATIAIGLPATQTLVPEIVPADLRPSANLLNQIGPSAGRTLGPLLAGMLIAVRNAATAFFGLTAVYVVAVMVTMRLPASPAGAAAPGSAIQQIADGLRYIRRTPILFWLLFLLTFATMFGLFLFPLVPAMAVEVLDTSAVQFGWMWGALSIGQALSAILLASLGGVRRNGAAMVVAMLIYSPCLVLFGLTHTYWLALVYLFGMGIAFPLWIAAALTLLQNFTAPEYRGRVMAVYAIAMQSISVSWLLGGWLIDVIGIFPTVLVAVGGVWAVLMTAMIASKELRSS
jgi:MFS family permease